MSSFRLLAVGSEFDLKLLEVEAERSPSISLLCVSECPADRLLQTVREQEHSEYHNQTPHHQGQTLQEKNWRH